jgi:hypothetical protein
MTAVNLKRFVYVCHCFLLLYFCLAEWFSDNGWGRAVAQGVSGRSMTSEA